MYKYSVNISSLRSIFFKLQLKNKIAFVQIYRFVNFSNFFLKFYLCYNYEECRKNNLSIILQLYPTSYQTLYLMFQIWVQFIYSKSCAQVQKNKNTHLVKPINLPLSLFKIRKFHITTIIIEVIVFRQV